MFSYLDLYLLLNANSHSDMVALIVIMRTIFIMFEDSRLGSDKSLNYVHSQPLLKAETGIVSNLGSC